MCGVSVYGLEFVNTENYISSTTSVPDTLVSVFAESPSLNRHTHAVLHVPKATPPNLWGNDRCSISEDSRFQQGARQSHSNP